MKILVTGTAGFIGFHLARRLLEAGDEVVGVDSVNDYYDVRLKADRLAQTGIDLARAAYGEPVRSDRYPAYRFVRLRLEDREGMERLFDAEHFDAVCNLAAQAGVRYSIENPESYVQSNVEGFLHVLEGCRRHGIGHLVYASSSSVYGGNAKVPFSEDDRTDDPVSLYAATKKAGELMARTYSHLYGFATTGLRFFTVYGPWGRPDMAPMLFSRAMLAGEPIRVFNNGDLLRDFTYIDDIVEGVAAVLRQPPASPIDRIYNIGCSQPVRLTDFIRTLEEALGCEARKQMLPMQAGDVYRTYADTSRLEADYGYRPTTDLRTGIGRFAAWYKTYYQSDLNP
ncbi:NAD-dependent epimerase [Alistipes sp.]|uniref:NAD-dependent epimerase n=1 Tax=Alistipes sp. TaxID=1872444 RepID=UPI003AB21ED3